MLKGINADGQSWLFIGGVGENPFISNLHTPSATSDVELTVNDGARGGDALTAPQHSYVCACDVPVGIKTHHSASFAIS